jgi:hypothetical protein
MGSQIHLQVLATFDAQRLERPLISALTASSVDSVLGFTSRLQMKEYMLSPSPETEGIAGTIVLARVEDWLRDVSSQETHTGDIWAREELKNRVREFASEISILAYRGKPVWFMICPSTGWVAEQHRILSLCRTYTNLLAARAGNTSEITVVNWPPGLAGNNLESDEATNVPFTQGCFDRIAEAFAGEIRRTLASPSTGQPASGKSPELAAYLAGLQVRVELLPASAAEAHYVDKIIRTAASFSLTGEQPNIADSEVNGVISSGKCALIAVTDRLAEHGPSGVLVFHEKDGALVVEWMSLSCTVLGKQVEYAVLSALAQIALEQGLSKIIFDFRRSARNQPLEVFLESVADREADTRFSLNASDAEARITTKAISPGAWTLIVRGAEKTAQSGN